MPNNECIPVFRPGQDLTGHCSAAVRGKRLVVPSAAPPGGAFGTENVRIAEAGAAADNVIGAAAYDGALDAEIPLLSGPGFHLPLVAGAAISAGDALTTDAQGRVVPIAAGNPVVAVAVDDAAAADDDVVCRINF